MFLIPIRMGAPLALTAAFGCTLHITEDPTASTTGASAETTATAGTTGATPTTTDPTAVTATDSATDSGTSATSGEPTGTTAETSAETGPEPPQWCNGFSPEATEFAVHNNKDEAIVDGSALAAECGGQGTIMIPVYPRFGGFVPDSDYVSFDVTLDVEGYNVGPDDHFFSVTSHVHKINCAQEQDTYYDGYSYSFIPMFPPDAVADINVIDGKPGHLHLTLHTPDGDLPFDADVVLSAAIMDCGY